MFCRSGNQDVSASSSAANIEKFLITAKPTKSPIMSLIKKFKETGSVVNSEIWSAENSNNQVKEVRALVNKKLQISKYRLADERTEYSCCLKELEDETVLSSL